MGWARCRSGESGWAVVKTFTEDIEMLEAQQKLTADRSLDYRTIATPADAGPTRARGIVLRLLREEKAGQVDRCSENRP